MRIKKKHFFLLVALGTFLLAIVLFFGISSWRSKSEATTTTQDIKSVEPAVPSIPTIASSLDPLDLTLHNQTKDLLKTPSYDTIIDKSADFSSVSIYLDGKLLSITDKPFKYKGRLYLPLRQVGESLGIKIGFNNDYKVALAESNDYRLELPLKYTKAVKIPLAYSDLASTLAIDNFNSEVSVVFYQEKTYLPVRFTAEALGFAVKYDEKENAVYFTSPK